MCTAKEIADRADIQMLSLGLADDVQQACLSAIRAGVHLPCAETPDAIFRYCVERSITDIQNKKGQLLRDFIVKGPYEKGGPIPEELKQHRLTDEQTAEAVAFIHSYIVNSFKGRLAEILALRPTVEILFAGKKDKSCSVELWFGDTVQSPSPNSSIKQSSDMHLLHVTPDHVEIRALVEVKSYAKSRAAILKQVNHHIERLQLGVTVDSISYTSDQVAFASPQPMVICVVPSKWKLSRQLMSFDDNGRSFFDTESTVPPMSADENKQIGNDWHVTLRWSEEALASEGYALSFWYIEQLGQLLHGRGLFLDGSDPATAATERFKAQLFYAYLRAPKHPNWTPEKRWFRSKAEQKAIAVSNCYAFGFALGTSFYNSRGTREILFVEDLERILSAGTSKDGHRLKGYFHPPAAMS